jgi:hypothetical protein
MSAFLGVLGESSVRTIVIAFTTVCVLRAMRVKSPAIRHSAWTGVLLAMLCLPFFSPWAPRVAIPVLPTHSVPLPQRLRSSIEPAAQVPDSRILAIEPAPLDISPLPASKYSRIANQAAPRLAAYRVAGILYLAGFCFLAFRLLAGTLLLRRLARGASGDGRILYSPQCTAPMTVGLFRARVLLPAESMDWDPSKLDAVLTHEMEHLRRRDPLIEWLALLNRSINWFNPLAWWLCCKLSALSEQVCDDAVLAQGHDSSAYAGHLLEFARVVKRRGSLVTVLGSSLNGSTLAHRIRRILNSGVSPAISPIRLVLVTAVWAVVAITPLFFELSPVHAAPPHSATVASPPEMPAPETRSTQSTFPIPQSGTVVPPDKALYETGKELFRQRQFIKARLAFQSLISSDPNSSLADSAYLAIADSYYEEGGAENLRNAEEQYRNFIEFFPRSPRAEDASMRIISINMKAMRSENGRLSNITGYVVNEAGKPIRGVSISAFEKAAVPMASVGSTSSDEQGYFTLRGIPLENKIEIHFAGEGLKPFVYDEPDPFSNPLRITMREISLNLQERQLGEIYAGYTLADLELKGSFPFDSEKLTNAFAIKKGEPFDVRLIKKTLEQIQQLFFNLGYIDFTYIPELDVNQNEKTVSCSIFLVPGKQYFVSKINISGIGSDEDGKEIISALRAAGLEEKTVFSSGLLEKAIKSLNELLDTKNLTLKDYELKRSSNVSGTVEINIRLQSKSL